MDLSRIEYFRVQNYRALRDVEFQELTPLTVFIGPDGSGKSTIIDAFAFLAESFQLGLRTAWAKRGKFKEFRTHGCDGPVTLEFRFRETLDAPLTTYHLKIGEEDESPLVQDEWIQWRGTRFGSGFRFLDLKHGKAMSRARLNIQEDRPFEQRTPPDVLSLSCLDQFPNHPRVRALRDFISSWHFSLPGSAISQSNNTSEPELEISRSANNLENVLQYWKSKYPWVLDKVLRILIHKLGHLAAEEGQVHADAKNLQVLRDRLQRKEALAGSALLGGINSATTLKLLYYLALFYDPEPLQLITIDEPEQQLKKELLEELAAECRTAAVNSHILATTSQTQFANALKPKELWVLRRHEDGATRQFRASDLPRIEAYINDGVLLGDLWEKGVFEGMETQSQQSSLE